MSKKHWITVTFILLILLIGAGCERPASKAPISTPQVIDNLNTPLPVDQQILNATMTAQAIMEKFGQPTVVVTNAEGTAVVATASSILMPTSTPAGTPTPTMLPATPVVTKPTEYTLHSGEFISCLARRFDVDVNEMLSLNGLGEYSILSVGQVVKVPTSGSFGTDQRAILDHPDTWTVSAGETVWGIACEYGDVYPEAIIAVNGLQEPYDLETGQVLQIP